MSYEGKYKVVYGNFGPMPPVFPPYSITRVARRRLRSHIMGLR